MEALTANEMEIEIFREIAKQIKTVNAKLNVIIAQNTMNIAAVTPNITKDAINKLADLVLKSVEKLEEIQKDDDT